MSTYREINHDQNQRLGTEINATLKRLQELRQISKEDRWRMKSNGSSIAQFHGLPKIHKEGIPLRLIAAVPGRPTYNLDKSLWKRLKPIIAGPEHQINNQLSFLEEFHGTNIEEDGIMFSFDIVSLFTSVPLDLARQTLQELLEHQRSEQEKSSSICELIVCCLRTYFTFEGTFCEQGKGSPKGLTNVWLQCRGSDAEI